MLRAEQPNVPVQECEVHQHTGLLQMPVPARLRPLGAAQLLCAQGEGSSSERLEGVTLRAQQRAPQTLKHLFNPSPYILHCIEQNYNRK